MRSIPVQFHIQQLLQQGAELRLIHLDYPAAEFFLLPQGVKPGGIGFLPGIRLCAEECLHRFRLPGSAAAQGIVIVPHRTSIDFVCFVVAIYIKIVADSAGFHIAEAFFDYIFSDPGIQVDHIQIMVSRNGVDPVFCLNGIVHGFPEVGHFFRDFFSAMQPQCCVAVHHNMRVSLLRHALLNIDGYQSASGFRHSHPFRMNLISLTEQIQSGIFAV